MYFAFLSSGVLLFPMDKLDDMIFPMQFLMVFDSTAIFSKIKHLY